MKGYKMTESDMTCRGFQYEVGKEYSLKSKLLICKNGFHFCENPFDCLGYYNNIEGDKRLFLVETLGKVISEDNKSVTNKIKILEEIKDIEKFFDENIKNFEVDWSYISIFQKLSEKFIEKYSDKINWHHISEFQKLSEKFIEKHYNKVDWYNISKKQTLSESFIEKHYDKVDWYLISLYQTLSESFIEKHYDKIDWNCISAYQTLSESFIEKHYDKVNWFYISIHQTLPKEFIEKHKDKI
jgi:hypothetical protein